MYQSIFPNKASEKFEKYNLDQLKINLKPTEI